MIIRHASFILLVFLLVSCNTKNTNQKSKFESYLGQQETDCLNMIINDFDSFLFEKYPNKTQNSSFKQYLFDIVKNKQIDYWKIDSTKFLKYYASNLFGKYDTIYPDSVWFDGQTFNKQFKELNSSVSISLFYKNKESIDSIIIDLKNQPKLISVKKSNFLLAFDKIKELNTLVNEYCESKETTNVMSPFILAEGLLYYHQNWKEDEYFAKRIFVMDLYLK